MTDTPNAVAVRKDTPAIETPESLVRFAIERQVDPATMERLVALQERVMASRAKSAFDEALAAFQSECPVIEKKKVVLNKDQRTVRYKFAPLDDVVAQVKVLLKTHGFSYSLDTEVKPNWVKAICKITHCAGHSQLSTFEVPIEGDAYMSQPQKYASSLTFCKRYAFLNGFGILTGDEDTDGKVTKEKPAGPAVATAETRKRMIDRLKDIEQQAIQYFINATIIMPNEGLEQVPLSEVPTTQKQFEALRQNILRQQ